VDKAKVVIVKENKPPWSRGQLRVDALEFILTYTKPNTKCSLMWHGVYPTPKDIVTCHVDPTATISDPLWSLATMPCPSFEASFDPAHHHHQRQRAY
jgi:hypothetical protein